jgi:hypothetical protein
MYNSETVHETSCQKQPNDLQHFISTRGYVITCVRITVNDNWKGS